MNGPPRQVKTLKIEILDPDILREYSVVKITNSSVQPDNRPNGVFDIKLGSTTYLERCGTCHKGHHECNGHFGYVDLTDIFFQPFFITSVYRIVQKHCWNCFKYCGENYCKNCDRTQGKWHRDGAMKDRFYHRIGSVKKEISIRDIYTMLKEHDKRLEGQDIQPTSWQLLTILPVAPPCIRPSILTNGNWSHHSLSHTYANVVKENSLLSVFQRQGRPHHILQQQWRRTQDQIYKIYDVRNVNEEKYMEGIRQRLDSKAGRFRKNLMGKRVDFSARTASL